LQNGPAVPVGVWTHTQVPHSRTTAFQEHQRHIDTLQWLGHIRTRSLMATRPHPSRMQQRILRPSRGKPSQHSESLWQGQSMDRPREVQAGPGCTSILVIPAGPAQSESCRTAAVIAHARTHMQPASLRTEEAVRVVWSSYPRQLRHPDAHGSNSTCVSESAPGRAESRQRERVKSGLFVRVGRPSSRGGHVTPRASSSQSRLRSARPARRHTSPAGHAGCDPPHGARRAPPMRRSAMRMQEAEGA
jgi:hypothetical protein